MATSTSPFPGMDPYLESPAFWPDFHASFITYWREQIADRLPDAYEARIDERVNLVQTSPEEQRAFRPDIAITQQPQSESSRPPSTFGPGGVATLEPVMVPLLFEEKSTETYVRILHRSDRELVAVLELLSPSNKEDPGRNTYLVRRNDLLYQEVHVVELDLLLKGQRIPLAKPYPAGQYFALVADATQRMNCLVYAWSMRQALPTIPIPLRAPDPPLRIDLAAVFATTYAKARYAKSINYADPPAMALSPEDAAWVRERASSAR